MKKYISCDAKYKMAKSRVMSMTFLVRTERARSCSCLAVKPKKSLSKPKSKVNDEHRHFRERWVVKYFFVLEQMQV